MHTRALLFVGACVVASASCASMPRGGDASVATPDSARIRADIEYLAGDALEGRGTGTPGFDSAAAFAARRYASLGLRALSPGFLQRFQARSAMLAHSGGPAAVNTQNVMAMLPGSDP